MVKYFMS